MTARIHTGMESRTRTKGQVGKLRAETGGQRPRQVMIECIGHPPGQSPRREVTMSEFYIFRSAERLLGEGRVRYVHPDCGFWMLKRPIADAKIRALVEGRDLYEGRTSRAAA